MVGVRGGGVFKNPFQLDVSLYSILPNRRLYTFITMLYRANNPSWE